MNAADTSVAVAAFASWHEFHARARAGLQAKAVLVAHCALETFSVLTRLPPPHRAPGRLVHDFLAEQFPDPYLVLRAESQRRLTARLLELGVEGGSVYDALVALTAAEAGATLLSCDRRAASTYARCGVDMRLLA